MFDSDVDMIAADVIQHLQDVAQVAKLEDTLQNLLSMCYWPKSLNHAHNP
jgi:hypothetical protein